MTAGNPSTAPGTEHPAAPEVAGGAPGRTGTPAGAATAAATLGRAATVAATPGAARATAAGMLGGPPAGILRAFVEELVGAGVREAVVCPGSRSTPLALALAAHPGIRVLVHLDERAGSYFALGMARTAHRPVAFLMTSGTAAVNAHPAVVEAHHARVPLVVLTSDRPPELRDRGAGQTIDQHALFGVAAKWFVDMPVPEPGSLAEAHWRSIAARAAHVAAEEPAGPVHVNLPFREPLIPDGDLAPAAPGAGGSGVDSPVISRPPYVTLATGARRLAAADLEALAERMAAARRPLIVCGPIDAPALPAAVGRLAAALDAPVFADPLSQVRLGPHDRSRVLSRGDLVVRRGAWIDAHVPDLVVRFGFPPTSKPLHGLLAAARPVQVIVDGGDGWLEPTLLPATIVHADPVALADDLSTALSRAGRDSAMGSATGSAAGSRLGAEADWARAWLAADAAADAAIRSFLAETAEPYEARVFDVLAGMLGDRAVLWAGSSMPVRDMDAYLPGGPHDVRILANRGANGIDGVYSSALGAAAVQDGPVVLVVGDVSFIHDLNALVAAKLHGLSATIVLVDNDGGGIFSFLPQATVDDPRVGLPGRFEELFGTPHGLGPRLGPVVEALGGRWIDLGGRGTQAATDPGDATPAAGPAAASGPADATALRDALVSAIGAPGVTVIRYATERSRNAALHRVAAERVAAALSALMATAAAHPDGGIPR